MARKKFVPQSAKESKKPIEFELLDQVLYATPQVPGVVLLDFIAVASDIEEEDVENEDAEKGAEVVSKIMPFFKAVLLPDSYKTFLKLTMSQENIIELPDLLEIFSWLMEKYTNRPLDGSKTS